VNLQLMMVKLQGPTDIQNALRLLRAHQLVPTGDSYYEYEICALGEELVEGREGLTLLRQLLSEHSKFPNQELILSFTQTHGSAEEQEEYNVGVSAK
jgi:hypothetical protein